ncbi:MAG: metal ABC transporter ATP-binding protein [Phycisphaerae bacterium]
MSDVASSAPAETATAAVWARELRLRAGGMEVLHVPSLRLWGGQTTVVFGPNGAGKTTLLRTMLGFHSCSEGQLEVLGERVVDLSGRGLSRFRRRVGYVPQLLAGRGEMPLTVREVVAIGRTGLRCLGARLEAEDWRIVDEWIERLGLSQLARRSYGELSGGEQRKTLIAKAMAKRPELLLLDEPTANLDLRAREQIVGILADLFRQTHVTGVLVCHEPEVIPPGTSQVVLLGHSRAIAAGRPEQVLTDERLTQVFGPGFSVVRRGQRFAMVPAGGGEEAQP